MSYMKDLFFDIMELGDFSYYRRAGSHAHYSRIPIHLLEHFRNVHPNKYKFVTVVHVRIGLIVVPSARHQPA